MVRRDKAGNPFDAWKVAVYNVMRYGKDVVDERGQKTKEVLDLVMEIADPTLVINEHDYWKGAKLEAYIEEVLSAKDKGFVYDYGNRLRGHFTNDDGKPIDQIMDLVVPRLRNNRNSRRATAITYDMPLDMNREEIPCLLLLDFKIRGNYLHTSAYWRSNDMYGAYYPNIRAVGRISELVAEQLGVWTGPLTTHAASAHIYYTDIEPASDVARRGNPTYMK